ncbi:hypothetical protein Rhe02_70120 [Rhizocola hellebori]|uniref:VWFA domain-containing protein n=1 Tax=Rhizocola hellebori TaxID=1392758 RepID=A0A8J3QFW8_9ACTN|nr:von Willebrand factor type A domain-containing protein [Rhizocola hellebori]GIH08945.1 hypothetical protein Rhe02_70120 [Rhizocola hellebori]
MRLRIPLLLVVTALVITGCGAEKDSSAPTKTREDNASTFALDVDTASYTFAARQLNDGAWPDASTVRPEEFLNAFDHHYAQPRGDGFAMHVDGARLPEAHTGSSSSRLLRIGLQTKSESSSERRDANLTFVIDVSGSMAEAGKLDLVQDALHYLVDQLQPSDAVAIVAFNDKASVIREMTRVSDKARLHEAIDRLKAAGSTNLGAGLTSGYGLARESFRERATNRVIILSDGLANTGTTNASTLVNRIQEEAAKEISLLGVGVGSDYGDKLMEELADKGDGFVVYISEQKQARELFVRKLPAALTVRAYDAKAQVVFDRSAVDTYQLIGYEDRRLEDNEFRDDTVDGGEIGPGHSVTALYLVKLRANASGRVAQVKVRWLDPKTRDASESYETVNVDDIDGTFARSDADLKVCYAAAYFAEALRQRTAPSFDELAKIADDANEELDDPKVGELATLIRKAAQRR